MPTPDSEYTPPRASPVTMNGLKSSQLGIWNSRRPLLLNCLTFSLSTYHEPVGGRSVLACVRLGSLLSTWRTCAIVGSASEMLKHCSLMTIFPWFGVVVQSTLFGMCSAASPKYQGRQRMSVLTPLRFLIAELTLFIE